jgi:hypothetical protein
MRFRAARARETRENLKSLAGIGVADSDHEEAEAKGQHDDVQHGILLVALACVAIGALRAKADCGESIPERRHNPALSRISGPEVPLDAYVFEAIVAATL